MFKNIVTPSFSSIISDVPMYKQHSSINILSCINKVLLILPIEEPGFQLPRENKLYFQLMKYHMTYEIHYSINGDCHGGRQSKMSPQGSNVNEVTVHGIYCSWGVTFCSVSWHARSPFIILPWKSLMEPLFTFLWMFT